MSEVPLKKAIHWLFECWWRRGLEGKEELGWTAFVDCLENTVTLKKTVMCVCVYCMMYRRRNFWV